ncbi:MAG TPA: N-acetylmuramoyl-L-alanine amidase [Gemmatimonadales bacterium]|nr:N-acetylmuramoyl-L-alanine amidase [Gemmatimonadales bacterium]
MTRALVWLLVAATPPETVMIATPRGETSVPVTMERGSAALAAPLLAAPLMLSVVLDGSRVLVNLQGTLFVFQLGAPYVRSGGTVYGLVAEPYTARDTVFLPLVWLTDCVPRALGPRYRWDATARRLEELPVADGVAATPPPGSGRPAPPPPAPPRAPVPAAPGPVTAGAAPAARDPAPNPLTGLRFPHTVVIDPGHGGADPGNPGLYFPSGLVEKDITLAIGRLLRAELSRRAIAASLTRTRDTLIDLADRGAFCRADCDLFVSIHVNAMPSGRRGERTSGVETYFLSEAKNEDQQRVANMENDAIRFEASPGMGVKGPVNFILKDLQLNEYLRESAALAQQVQGHVAAVHPGGDHGVQQAGFTVLTTARRPAILVEAGFATNRTDAAFLASGVGEHKIASAIADGIVQYLQEFEHKVAVGTRAGGR